MKVLDVVRANNQFFHHPITILPAAKIDDHQIARLEIMEKHENSVKPGSVKRAISRMGKKVNNPTLAREACPLSMGHSLVQDFHINLAVVYRGVGKNFCFSFDLGDKDKKVLVVNFGNFLVCRYRRWRGKFIMPESSQKGEIPNNGQDEAQKNKACPRAKDKSPLRWRIVKQEGRFLFPYFNRFIA